ncbi:MAG: META domain-containing protein [Chitinophagales bacterium]
MNSKLLTAFLLTLLFVFQNPAIGKCNGGKAKGDIFRNWTLSKLPNFSTEQINTIGTVIPNIHFTDGQVVGFGGCNTLRGGKYTIRKDKIKLDNIGSTRKMCIGIEADVEREFIPLLNKADHFVVEGKKLIIYTTDNKEMEFISK